MADALSELAELSMIVLPNPGVTVAPVVEKTECVPSGSAEHPDVGSGLAPFHQ